MTGFFAIDRRTWAAACALGLNPAVTYLVLGAGTGRDNRSSAWSATAIHKYTGMAWQRGRPAIDTLLKASLVLLGEGHTTGRPRYELPSWAEVSHAHLEKRRNALSEHSRRLLAKPQNRQSVRKRDVQALDALCDQGVLFKKDGGYTLEEPATEPDYLWVPNSLVTGTDKGEASPLRRLRSAGDIWALRLLVDLYHAQNLRDDGGISPCVIYQNYDRMLVGEQGLFKVWGFKPGQKNLWWAGPFKTQEQRQHEPEERHPVWDNVYLLENLGLLRFVPHLWESDPKQSEVLHAYGIEDVGGETLEVDLGGAAHAAAEAMVPDWKTESACEEGYIHLAPVKDSIPNVQMVGVARLTYRPHTKRTAQWFAELHRSAPDYIRLYGKLRGGAERRRTSPDACTGTDF